MIQFWVHLGAIEPVLGRMEISAGFSMMKLILCKDVLVMIIVSTTSGDPYLQFVRFIW